MNRRAAAGLAALTLALTGCATTDASTTVAAEAPGTVLTSDELQSVLLTPEDVDPALTVAASEGKGKSSGPDMGCLESLEHVDFPDAAHEAEVEFEGTDGIPTVFNSTASFNSEADVTAALDDIREELANCGSVTFEDDEASATLTVTTDDTPASPDVDQQVNIAATGTMEAHGLTLPMGFWISLARIDNHAVATMMVDISDTGAGDVSGYMATSAAKMTAALNGKPIPTAPARSAGSADDAATGDSADGENTYGEDYGESASGPASAGLPLQPGPAVTLPASDDSGWITWDTPVEVAFESITCDTTIPGAGYDDDYDTVDFVAADGDKACLVELAVTNVSDKPNSFGSSGSANLETTDGVQFGETSQSYDDQGIAHSKGREPSFTANNIQPGKTKYDYVIFEIPKEATPQSLVYSIHTAS